MTTAIAEFDALERRAVEAAMIYRYGQLVELKDAEGNDASVIQFFEKQ